MARVNPTLSANICHKALINKPYYLRAFLYPYIVTYIRKCRFNLSSTQRWNGWTGLIIDDYWNRSATFPLQSSSRRIMINWKVRLLRPESHKRVSGIPGAIQNGNVLVVIMGFCHIQFMNILPIRLRLTFSKRSIHLLYYYLQHSAGGSNKKKFFLKLIDLPGETND